MAKLDIQQLLVEASTPSGNTATWLEQSGAIWGLPGNSNRSISAAAVAESPQFTIQTYTPGSDLAAAFRKNQIVYGRDGNDTLVGLNPFANNPNQLQIDVFIGDLPIIQSPNTPNWSDRFVLGDWKQPYYVDGGLNDFTTILDFNRNQDIIQLHGTPADYQLVTAINGTEILHQQGTVTDRIAQLPLVFGLSLEDNYFQFEGDTSPQGPVLTQTKQLGTAGFDLSSTSAIDTFGNVYIAGGTTGSLGKPNAGLRDAFVTKYDSDGDRVWTKQFGTSSFDTVYGITTDNNGNFYVSGTTEGSLAGTRQASFSDAFVAKYDSNGNQDWIRQFGTADINLSFDINVDDDSNVYLSGLTVKPAPGLATTDAWTTKYDSNGNRQWFSEFGSSDFDDCYGVAVGGNGNVYASGFTIGNLGGQNAGLYDAWVSKHDNSGNLQWVRQFGTENYEFSWDVAADSQGNSYSTGWTLGNLGGQNAGSYDAFLAKYDNSGNQVWIEQFGTRGDDEAFGVEVLDGNIFVTGYTDNNLEGRNAGDFDAWVAKYDSNGNRNWIQQFGTPDSDQALGVTADNAGNLYVTGTTEGSFGGTNAGSVDSWVAKLNATSGTLLDFSGSGTSGSVIDGTPNNDTLLGTQGNDIIRGFNGQDVLRGSSGDDSVEGGNGNDKLFTAAGNDTLIGGAGNDSFRGGPGSDILTGVGSENGRNSIDRLSGDRGSDLFILGNTTTVFYNDGNNANGGRSDYAVIQDFNKSQDKIQMEGSASRYLLGSSPIAGVGGTATYLDTNGNRAFNSTDELIAIVQGSTDLSLTSSYFSYV